MVEAVPNNPEQQELENVLPMRTLCALTEQVSGQKVIYMDGDSGAICKTCHGNELKWYQQCHEGEALAPFLPIIPQVVDQFRLRFGVDKIDL